MREIKFRAWNETQKIMEEVSAIDFTHNDESEDIEVDIITKEAKICDKLIAMQFTGLKDKNGVEIYEGDKIEFTYWWFDGGERETHLKGVIEYDTESLSYQLTQIDNEWFQNYTGYEKGEGKIFFGELRFSGEDFEVIGNIYEGVKQ